MSLKVSGSSYAQQGGVHDPSSTGPLATPSSVGPATGFADRIYNDGYVKRDPGTGNPTTLDPNTTWNWGYDQAGQYNAGAQTLTFSKEGAPGYSGQVDRPVSGSEQALGGGLQLRGGVVLTKSEKWSVDLCLGFQGLWGADSAVNATPYREQVSEITVHDRYDASGIGVANMPGPGHRGTYLGPFDNPPVIPSPILPNVPSQRSTTSKVLSSSEDHVSLEAQPSLYQLSLGPQISYALSQKLKLSLRPTISANLIDLDVPRSEIFVQEPVPGASAVVRHWSDHTSKQEVLLGLGLSGEVDLDLGKGFYGGVFAGYEWVTEKVTANVGPNSVSFDGSGYVVGLTVGKRF